MRSMQFKAKSPDEAHFWQEQARNKLFELMMGGSVPEKTPQNPQLVQREEVPGEGYFLEASIISRSFYSKL